VQNRLEHLKDNLVDALVMARAGLDRLGISVSNMTAIPLLNSTMTYMAILTANEMLPGPGQGIIGVICRKDDTRTIKLLQSIDDIDARIAATAERQVLNTVDANLVKPYRGRPPLAAFMEPQSKHWLLRARLLRPDGKEVVEVERQAPRDCSEDDARSLGEQAGAELVRHAGDRFFGEMHNENKATIV
jgi:hydroxymethylbilane synthase